MNVEVYNPRFTQVVGGEVEFETLSKGFSFLEGPVWNPHRDFLIFSDIAGNKMYRWSRQSGLSVFRDPSNMANGNTYDRQERLLTCEHATSRVVRQEDDLSIKVLASHYDDRELNSPNDIVVKSDGSIYFTDPTSGRKPFYGVPREQQLPFQGVYRLEPENQKLTLLESDFTLPNGLCFSLDEKRLFVNDTERRHIRVFDVLEDGSLANGRVWTQMGEDELARPDGMKFDQEGNLYCAVGLRGIYVFDTDGKWLGVIKVPEKTANIAWGDHDYRSLYLTASTRLYRIRVRVPGTKVF